MAHNPHPTVKPLKLMMYLVELGCRERGVVLDPFVGSGTTMLASKLLMRSCIGIEIENNNQFRRLRILSFLSIMIGDIGFIGIGIFSLDRNYFYTHFLFASFVLCVYIFAAFFISLLIVLRKFSLPTIMGVIGLICVIFLLSFAIVANFIFTFFITIFEWSLVIFVSIWLYSFTLSLMFKKSFQWFL